MALDLGQVDLRIEADSKLSNKILDKLNHLRKIQDLTNGVRNKITRTKIEDRRVQITTRDKTIQITLRAKDIIDIISRIKIRTSHREVMNNM